MWKMVAKGRPSFPFGFRRWISSGELLVSGRVTFEEIAFRSIDFLETLRLEIYCVFENWNRMFGSNINIFVFLFV